MIRNYLLVALRSLSRQRIYSVVNVTGLAVGVATTLTGRSKLLQVNDETFYENGREADDRFFHVFSFEAVSGAPDGSLTDPASIVLTEELASPGRLRTFQPLSVRLPVSG